MLPPPRHRLRMVCSHDNLDKKSKKAQTEVHQLQYRKGLYHSRSIENSVGCGLPYHSTTRCDCGFSQKYVDVHLQEVTADGQIAWAAGVHAVGC